MTLEQFAARVADIVGNDHYVARVAIRRDQDDDVARYYFETYTETAGWLGINPPCEEPEVLLRVLAEKHGIHKTDPMDLLFDA